MAPLDSLHPARSKKRVQTSRLEAIEAIASLVHGYSVEISPRAAATVERFSDHLPEGTRVFVACIPGTTFNDLIATCIRLAADGMTPVPHIPARRFPDEATLAHTIERLTRHADVREVLVIGGSDVRPAGRFTETMAVLESGLLEAHGIERIHVGGHPEGSPVITDQVLADAITRKNAYAERSGARLALVTQFVFDGEPAIAWLDRIRHAGNRLPVRIGLPGPAGTRTLMRYAAMCGLGNSARFLTRNAGLVARLARPQTPARSLAALAEASLAAPERGIEAVHFYSFGGLIETARWANAVQAGAITVSRDGRDFEVTQAYAGV